MPPITVSIKLAFTSAREPSVTARAAYICIWALVPVRSCPFCGGNDGCGGGGGGGDDGPHAVTVTARCHYLCARHATVLIDVVVYEVVVLMLLVVPYLTIVRLVS